MHQKHPPAKVATAGDAGGVSPVAVIFFSLESVMVIMSTPVNMVRFFIVLSFARFTEITENRERKLEIGEEYSSNFQEAV
jgi:hypothetical protein